MRAIISWRDAIGEGKVLLRDVIDLEATYGGPSRRARTPRPASRRSAEKAETAARAAASEAAGRGGRGAEAESRGRGRFRRGRPVALGDGGHGQGRRARRPSTRSPQTYERLRAPAGAAAGQPAAQRADRCRARCCGTSRRATRWSSWSTRSTSTRTGSRAWSSSSTTSTGASTALEGKLLRLAESCRTGRELFLRHYRGYELDPEWVERMAAHGDRWTTLRRAPRPRDRGDPHRHQRHRQQHRAAHRRAAPDRRASSRRASARPAAPRRRWSRPTFAS